MSFNIIRTPGKYSHVENPILFSINTENEKNLNVSIKIRDIEIFKSSYFADSKGIISFDIADVLRGEVSGVPISNALDVVVSLSTMTTEYTVIVSNKSSEQVQFDGYAVAGGVSNTLLRELNNLNENIFSYRLTNAERQFLFTTRTHGRHVWVRETEMCPVVCIHPGVAISFVCEYGHIVVTPAQEIGKVFAINISKIRKQFFDDYRVVVSFLSVLINGKTVFDLSIIEAKICPVRHIVQFRNSLAAYELIEITGNAVVTQENKEDVSEISRYDVVTNSFVKNVPRHDWNTVLKIKSGFKTPEELRFMQDMIASDDIYLIDQHRKRKVLVTADEYLMNHPRMEPESISLTLKFVDDERNYSPFLDDYSELIGFGQWFLEDGYINSTGFIYNDAFIKSI